MMGGGYLGTIASCLLLLLLQLSHASVVAQGKKLRFVAPYSYLFKPIKNSPTNAVQCMRLQARKTYGNLENSLL